MVITILEASRVGSKRFIKLLNCFIAHQGWNWDSNIEMLNFRAYVVFFGPVQNYVHIHRHV